MAKTKEIIPQYKKPPLHWLILKGYRKLFPVIPYSWTKPDLKLFKKAK